MTCWRCGRVEHTEWCSDGTPNDCDHCGGNPCRWWCLGEEWRQERWSAGARQGLRDTRGRFTRAAA